MSARTRFALPESRGFTLVEMIVTVTVLLVLTMAVMPVAQTAVKRDREIELRRSLREIREALDAYKRLADEKRIETEEESEGYPPDLATLVKGVEVKKEEGAESESESKIVRFLRRIPRDPMTGSTDWGLRSYQDAPDAESWGEENVFDVYTKHTGKALDGTRYRDW